MWSWQSCVLSVCSLADSFIPRSWLQPIWAFEHFTFVKGMSMAAPQGSPLWTSGKWQAPVWYSPASNVSVQSSRRKPTWSTFYCIVTGTDTERERGVIKDGGRNWREFRSLSGFLYGSVHLTYECTPDTSLLGLAFCPEFSLSLLCLNALKNWWFMQWGRLMMLIIQYLTGGNVYFFHLIFSPTSFLCLPSPVLAYLSP